MKALAVSMPFSVYRLFVAVAMLPLLIGPSLAASPATTCAARKYKAAARGFGNVAKTPFVVPIFPERAWDRWQPLSEDHPSRARRPTTARAPTTPAGQLPPWVRSKFPRRAGRWLVNCR